MLCVRTSLLQRFTHKGHRIEEEPVLEQIFKHETRVGDNEDEEEEIDEAWGVGLRSKWVGVCGAGGECASAT